MCFNWHYKALLFPDSERAAKITISRYGKQTCFLCAIMRSVHENKRIGTKLYIQKEWRGISTFPKCDYRPLVFARWRRRKKNFLILCLILFKLSRIYLNNWTNFTINLTDMRILVAFNFMKSEAFPPLMPLTRSDAAPSLL